MFLAIWWIEYSIPGGLEYSVPRRNDTRLNDTWDRRIGYEEDWPSQEHLDGYEAKPGKDVGRQDLSRVYLGLMMCCYLRRGFRKVFNSFGC